jgi:hypothetical protein
MRTQPCLRLHTKNKKIRGATQSRLDGAAHEASVSGDTWEKKHAPREKKGTVGVALGVARRRGFEAGRSWWRWPVDLAFIIKGDVARDDFILLVGCHSSPTPFVFSYSKNNFPLILAPLESLILRELTVLWRSGWRSDGMATWRQRKTRSWRESRGCG